MITTDLAATGYQSLLLVTPTSPEGHAWLRRNTGWTDDEPTCAVEHRYGPDLLLGAHRDGLAVTLDGRRVDCAR